VAQLWIVRPQGCIEIFVSWFRGVRLSQFDFEMSKSYLVRLIFSSRRFDVATSAAACDLRAFDFTRFF